MRSSGLAAIILLLSSPGIPAQDEVFDTWAEAVAAEIVRAAPLAATSTQYFSGAEQERIARTYIAQLDAAKQFRKKIVTEVVPLQGFYPAEPYHQNYAERHPSDLYIMINDRPKVEDLRKRYPDLYVEKRSAW